MSPDTVSSLYPDRPIRPLPRRRLREKLSPEVVESIKFPLSALDSVPLFRYPPCSPREDGAGAGRRIDLNVGQYGGSHGSASRTSGEEENNRRTIVTRPTPELLNRASRLPVRPDQPRFTHPQAPASTTSSVDGYDSFENTNNKKKRKIPSAGDPMSNGVYGFHHDTPAMSGGAVREDTFVDRTSSAPPVYSYNGNHGISGSGRGRLGRSGNGRSPLRVLPDGSNSLSTRSTKSAQAHWPSSEYQSGGIISNAIANAEKLAPQGQENVSVMNGQSSPLKTAPAATQFTFTCDSQVPGNLQWPGDISRSSMGPMASRPNGDANGANHASRPSNNHGSSSKEPTRRQIDKELQSAARRRRQIAAEKLHRNPPKLEDVWVCEFCEYERIFGTPPRAFIREYEAREQRERHTAANFKRTQDRKAKGRKGKKNANKTNKSGGVATGNSSDQTTVDSPTLDNYETSRPRQGTNSTQSDHHLETDPPDPPTQMPRSGHLQSGIMGLGLDAGHPVQHAAVI